MAQEQSSTATKLAIAALVAVTMLLAGVFVYQFLAPGPQPTAQAKKPGKKRVPDRPRPPRFQKARPQPEVPPQAPPSQPAEPARAEAAAPAKAEAELPKRDLGIRNESIQLYAPMAASCIREARVRDSSMDVSFDIELDVVARPGQDTRVLAVRLSHERVKPDDKLRACIEKTGMMVDLPEIKFSGRQTLKMAISAEGF